MKEESDEILSTDRDLKSLDITSVQTRYCFHLGRFLPAFLISNFSQVNICSVLQNSTRTSSLEVVENRRSKIELGIVNLLLRATLLFLIKYV